tara:strand:- start:181 stop:732 length:552 start_codon:yes stop_codon:yes gene_type:complete
MFAMIVRVPNLVLIVAAARIIDIILMVRGKSRAVRARRVHYISPINPLAFGLRVCIIGVMKFSYTLIRESSFTFDEDHIGRTPPDEVIEKLSDILDESERFCLKALFGMSEMSDTDLKVINAICVVSQDLKKTPVEFMFDMKVDYPHEFMKGFSDIARAWRHNGILPDPEVPSAEELTQQFEM